LWGVIGASSSRALFSADSQQRMLNFTELVATAIANAESRSELAASRARIVAASDQTRRHIERDLHDGVQQRLVSLALEVRAAQSALPPAVTEVRAELSHVVEGLAGALDELREISRGIHPAILSEGGLGAALKTLARRAPIPVALDVCVEDMLSDGIEVAAYYAISELVTNTAKHAHASAINVAVTSADGVVHIAARDDGIGGADPARGSGLVGLRDRIEALGGTISVQSPKGEGTAVEVALPLGGDRHAGDNRHDDHRRRQPAPAAFRS
ncbi:MAG: Oxygen sensor histidine kinase nreB, partial [Jatrophihabitans sp.]|nr:Oxygen sensor histidine kinase nreB [Jatrophihabitans sp.]